MSEAADIKLTEAQAKLLERAAVGTGTFVRGSSQHRCAETLLKAGLLAEPYEYRHDFVCVTPAGKVALARRRPGKKVQWTRHQWGPNDACRRCGLRRSGYSGGRTGSMSYTPLHGPVRARAGRCLPETDEELRLRLVARLPVGSEYSAEDIWEASGAKLDALAEAEGTKRYGAEEAT